MSKALIEKAFNEWIKYRAGLDKYSAMSAWQAGATWQREQLEAEILNKEKSWYAEFPDEKSAQEVFNIIKELQTENKTIREQLIQELREWTKKQFINVQGANGFHIYKSDLLAKLDDLLEGEK